MTDERNFDRLARAWLDLMPDEAPDRTIAAVLQAVETAPQARPPIRWLTRRFPNMNRLSMVAALAAATVLAVGGGLWLTRSDGPNTGGGPSPSPAPSASPSAGLSPEELQYTWLGEVVEAPDLPVGRDRSFLQIEPLTVELIIAQPDFLLSDITAGDPGVLRLVARNATGGCSPGDVGLYTWSLSPKGTKLQLVATEGARLAVPRSRASGSDRPAGTLTTTASASWRPARTSRSSSGRGWTKASHGPPTTGPSRTRSPTAGRTRTTSRTATFSCEALTTRPRPKP